MSKSTTPAPKKVKRFTPAGICPRCGDALYRDRKDGRTTCVGCTVFGYTVVTLTDRRPAGGGR